MRSASRSFDPNHMILLAPKVAESLANFSSIQTDPVRHRLLLGQAQRLRGRIYHEDGAIGLHHLTQDGRFVHDKDEESWQFLIMNATNRVSGCIRYVPQEHHVSFSQLGVAHSALAHSPGWGIRLRQAVEAKREEAQKRGYGYAEVGGWALIQELRHSWEALRITLNVYGLMKLLGGALAVTTATIRHRSATILRKLGGHGLLSDGVELPSYYDPQYECQMEILGFDSDNPNPKYLEWIHECQRKLRNLTVICPGVQIQTVS